jgi:HD-like signal output (HDOD) protein
VSQAYPNTPLPEILIAGLRQLPPTARVLARLQQLLMDPNSSLDDISVLLKLDASLVTRIIQISNSILFRRGDACTDIEQSVNRVGFREIYRLVAIVTASNVVAGPLPAYDLAAEQVWTDSIACAIGAELIAQTLNEDTALAYTAGLLHGIGRQPINHFLQNLDKGRRLAGTGFPLDSSHAEFAFFAYTQAEVGARMLKKWDFPEGVIEAVRGQYAPLSAPAPHDRTACMLYAARLLHAQVSTGNEQDAVPDEADILSELRLDRTGLMELAPALERGIEHARTITQSMR